MADVENITLEPEPAYLPIVRPETIQNNQVGSSSPEPNCAICLGRLENTSYTDSCLHQFCFSCISTWSKIKRECPLCKQNFNSIIHNVRSENDYDQCQVETEPQPEPNVPNYVRFGRLHWQNQDWNEFRQRIDFINNIDLIDRFTLGHPLRIPVHERRSLRFRYRVYREMLYSLILRNRTLRPRESSPEFYRRNPLEVIRLIPFIRRELAVLLIMRYGSNETVNWTVQTITNALERRSIRSYGFHITCRSLMGNTRAYIFRHELWNFATSGYDVVGYDTLVKYYPSELLSRVDSVFPRRNSWNILLDTPNSSEVDNDVHIVDEVQVIVDPPVVLPTNMMPIQANNVPEVLDISRPDVNVHTISDSSSISSVSSAECEIIGVVRPEDRVYELVNLTSDDTLSSDDDIIEISESSSSSSSSTTSTESKEEEYDEEEDKTENENKSQVSLNLNLPSTSYQNNAITEQSYTPPIESELSIHNEEIPSTSYQKNDRNNTSEHSYTPPITSSESNSSKTQTTETSSVCFKCNHSPRSDTYSEISTNSTKSGTSEHSYTPPIVSESSSTKTPATGTSSVYFKHNQSPRSETYSEISNDSTKSDTSEHTPPVASESSTAKIYPTESHKVYFKRSHSPSSDADSDLSRDSTKTYRKGKIRRTLNYRTVHCIPSSDSDSDEESSSTYRSRKSHKRPSSHHSRSSQKSKKSKRERHRDSSSTSRKERKDKRTKKHKKHRESKYRRSEKKSSRSSH